MEILLPVIGIYWVLKGLGVSMVVTKVNGGMNTFGDFMFAVALIIIWPVISGISETARGFD